MADRVRVVATGRVRGIAVKRVVAGAGFAPHRGARPMRRSYAYFPQTG
ncbi:hypothetical protein PY32053_02185 [Paracoccus yeei]|uniref:Uncharacterized protein n=1 Tax=Paracoccus yeei TaxID=147645 RepID=A0A386UN45_9RHOB|nr:hypothetical protein PY32053_02185 [Paracoccus yeei]